MSFSSTVTTRLPRSPWPQRLARHLVDHLDDGEVLGQVRAVPLVARGAEERQRLEARARHQVLLGRMVAGDREIQVRRRIEAARRGLRRRTSSRRCRRAGTCRVAGAATPRSRRRRATSPTGGPDGMFVTPSASTPCEKCQPPAFMPNGCAFARLIPGRSPQRQRPRADAAWSTSRSLRVHRISVGRPLVPVDAPEAHGLRDRRAAVVAERRMLLLARAELVLARRRQVAEVVEPAHVGALACPRLRTSA